MRRRHGKALLKAVLALVGVVISAVLLSTAFFKWNLKGPGPMLVPRFSLGDFVKDLPGHLVWLIPFMLLSAAIIPLRGAPSRSACPSRTATGWWASAPSSTTRCRGSWGT